MQLIWVQPVTGWNHSDILPRTTTRTRTFRRLIFSKGRPSRTLSPYRDLSLKCCILDTFLCVCAQPRVCMCVSLRRLDAPVSNRPPHTPQNYARLPVINYKNKRSIRRAAFFCSLRSMLQFVCVCVCHFCNNNLGEVDVVTTKDIVSCMSTLHCSEYTNILLTLTLFGHKWCVFIIPYLCWCYLTTVYNPVYLIFCEYLRKRRCATQLEVVFLFYFEGELSKFLLLTSTWCSLWMRAASGRKCCSSSRSWHCGRYSSLLCLTERQCHRVMPGRDREALC